MSTNLLVTGASGPLGQAIVEHLIQIQKSDSSFHIIAASRNLEKIDRFKSFGVELRKVDFLETSSLDIAFQGVDRLLLISTDVLGSRFTAHKNAIDAAVRSGVKHILYTSCAHPAIDRPLYDEHYLTEAYLTAATNVGFTILRNGLYQEVLLFSLPGSIAHGGQFYTAQGDGKRGYLSRNDLALANARAASDKFAGENARRLYELTTAEVFTGDEVASMASEVAEKPLKHVNITSEQLFERLCAFLPENTAAALAEIDAHTREGFDFGHTDHFEQLVGRRPHSLKDFFIAHQKELITPPTTH